MEPAASIIEKLGGAPKVAEICDVHRTRVYSWMRDTDAGGTGGRIPQTHIPTLLAYAAKNKITLKAADFFQAAA